MPAPTEGKSSLPAADPQRNVLYHPEILLPHARKHRNRLHKPHISIRLPQSGFSHQLHRKHKLLHSYKPQYICCSQYIDHWYKPMMVPHLPYATSSSAFLNMSNDTKVPQNIISIISIICQFRNSKTYAILFTFLIIFRSH